MTTNDTAMDDASSISGALGSTLTALAIGLLLYAVLTTAYVRLRQPSLFSAGDEPRLEEVAVDEDEQPTNDHHEPQEPPSMG